MSSEVAIKARRSDGSIDSGRLSSILHVTEAELVASVGLGEASVAADSGYDAAEEQRRLGELVELLERLTPWSGDARAAFDWYLNQPIAGFGKTAQDLVRSGRVPAVLAHLDRIKAGGYS